MAETYYEKALMLKVNEIWGKWDKDFRGTLNK